MGRLYRSDSLSKLHGADWQRFRIEHRPYDRAALGPSVEPVRYLADRYAEVAEDGVKDLRQTLEVLATGKVLSARSARGS